MSRNALVLVHSQREFAERVASACQAAGFDMLLAKAPQEGVNSACAVEAVCFAVDLTLGSSSLAAIRTLREDASGMAAIGIIGITHAADRDVSLSAFANGADVVLREPVTAQQLVDQALALLSIRARVVESGAVRASLTQFSIVSLLSALETERASGEVVLTDPRHRTISVTLAGGRVAGGKLASIDMSAPDIVAEALAWRGERFEFVPGPPKPTDANLRSVESLVLRAMRESTLPPPMERERETSPPSLDDVTRAFSSWIPTAPPPPMASSTSEPPSGVVTHRPQSAGSISDKVTAPPPSKGRGSKRVSMPVPYVAPGKDLVESNQTKAYDPRQEPDDDDSGSDRPSTNPTRIGRFK